MNYESHIQGDKPVIAFFFAGWSQASKLAENVFRDLSSEIGDRAGILSVDIDEESAIAEYYEIRTVPTVIIFRKGKKLWRKDGIPTLHEILQHLELLIV